MRKLAYQLDREITKVLAAAKLSGRAPPNKTTRIAAAHSVRTTSHARKRKPHKTPHEIQTRRLKALQGVMRDALGDPAWSATDLTEIEKWISVDPELSDREWLEIAENQLLDASVLPEHAGAPPPNVYIWNDVFLSTYRMNIDEGMPHEEALASARQRAFSLQPNTIKRTLGFVGLGVPSSTRIRRRLTSPLSPRIGAM